MKKIIFATLLFTLFISNATFGQSNAIKGVILPVVPIAGYASVSYERLLNQHNSLSFGVGELVFSDEMGLVYWLSSAVLEYRYIFTSKSAILNNTWTGVYLSYMDQTHTHSEGKTCSQQYYSGGLLFGKRVLIKPSNRMFFDFGFGCSYGVRYHAYGSSPTIMPRAIINFGYLF